MGLESDSRILDPVQHDSEGVKVKDFSSAVGRMREEIVSGFALKSDRPWLGCSNMC